MKCNFGLLPGLVKFGIAASLLLLGVTIGHVQAAAAVAIGVGPDGKMRFGYSAGGTLNEEATRSRALGFCMAGGVVHPKFIASTSKRGYGAIVMYEMDDKKYNFAATVAAASEQQAIDEALRKAKAAGGRRAKVWRRWHDVPSTMINL